MNESNSWQEKAIGESGVKVPEWELEPTGAEQTETFEASVGAEQSIAKKRLEEIAAETKETPPENPEQKAVQVEAMRAEVAEMAKHEASTPKKETHPSSKETREFEQIRHDSEKQFSTRAGIRNEKRGLFSKIFGRNKTEGIDIAHEEALQANALIEKRQLQTQESSTESSRNILESREFQVKSKSQIENEEAARKLAPKVTEALERGDFALARKEERNLKFSGSEEQQKARRGFEVLFNQKVESAIKSGDERAMKEIVETTPYIYKEIGLDMLSRMPKEIIQNKTLQREFEGSLSGLIVNAHDPEASVKLANELINKGLMDIEKVHKVYGSKEVQNQLSFSISGYVLNASDPEKAIENAQKFMRMGLMDKASVSAILQSPDIQNKVKQDVAGWVQNARNPQRAENELNRYLLLGIVTQEKAEQIKREYIK